MKLAEALLLRSEYQKKIENLNSRILTNVKVQEGEAPHENPEELLNELFSLTDKLSTLICKINTCNNELVLPNGKNLAQILTERDTLIKKRNVLSGIVSNANEKDYRLTHAEVKMCVTLKIGELQKQIDSISKEFRELDTKIQGLNWTTNIE